MTRVGDQVCLQRTGLQSYKLHRHTYALSLVGGDFKHLVHISRHEHAFSYKNRTSYKIVIPINDTVLILKKRSQEIQ